MGARSSGGAGGGSRKGGNTRAIQELTNKVVRGFTSDQRSVYDAMVERGLHSALAAWEVGKAVQNGTFKMQPLSYIKSKFATNRPAADIAQRNKAMSNTLNKDTARALKMVMKQ